MKTCSRCEVEKDESEFPKRARAADDGELLRRALAYLAAREEVV